MAATTTVEKGYRQVIESYQSLLEKNLILTDDFFRTLVTHGVFSEPLLNDIKTLPAQERTHKMVELLMTRTATGFRKFVDVLEVTGHHFLSDCLREAETGETISDIDINDLSNRLPFINKTLKTEQQKNAVRQFFREAIQKEVVRCTWKGDIHAKEQLIISRQKQIEQLWQFEEEEKIREKSMLELQEKYLSLQNFTDDLRRETKSLHKHIEDLNKKHKDELKAQVDFNMANDRHLTRLNEKADDAGSILDNLHMELKAVLADGYQTKPTITDYQNLQNNFDLLCAHYRKLAGLVEHFRDERHYMSHQIIGIAVLDKADFKEDFRAYILKNEEEFTRLKTQIAKLTQSLTSTATKLRDLEIAHKRIENGEAVIDSNTAKLVALEEENEKNKAAIISKDDTILALEKQLKSLNSKFKSLEAVLQESQQNERHLHDAVEAAANSVAAVTATGNSEQETTTLPENQDSEVGDVPVPPPPTQYHQSLKIRNKSFDASAAGSNAYLLKKRASGPIYLMDEDGEEVSKEKLSNRFIEKTSDPIKFKHPPSLPAKSKATAATNYSKRLAASKALKQNKTGALPATLLKMK